MPVALCCQGPGDAVVPRCCGRAKSGAMCGSAWPRGAWGVAPPHPFLFRWLSQGARWLGSGCRTVALEATTATRATADRPDLWVSTGRWPLEVAPTGSPPEGGTSPQLLMPRAGWILGADQQHKGVQKVVLRPCWNVVRVLARSVGKLQGATWFFDGGLKRRGGASWWLHP
eukprot:354691-Chlamydomonas_euryale.AAC.17